MVIGQRAGAGSHWRGRLLGGLVAVGLAILPLEGAEASERCRNESRSTSIGTVPVQWAYSGVRKRTYVRLQRDCPCQVIVRSFRSRRTYECPCLPAR